MKELIAILDEAARAYYNDNSEIMSNLEYDALYDELSVLEAETGIVFPKSPTQKVGYEIVGNLIKVRHKSRMLSLDKTKDIEKLESFLKESSGDIYNKTEGLLSWKLDGLTIVLYYEDGVLKQAVTRGNGEIGEDITHNAKVFKNTPKIIPFKGKLVLRGEAVIPYSEFEKTNENLDFGEKYKNPRNLCSGTVRQLNSEICAKRNVNFFAFSLVKADGINTDFQNSKWKQLSFLKEQGFAIAETIRVTSDSVANAVQYFSDNINVNDFASDGLVLTYDDIAFSRSLGETSKFPKDSIAFKWMDETCETTLLDIIWNTSRTGLINPIAVFKAVELEGTTVNRASLHNVSIVESLKLGVGDTITVYKANMIIPQILENLTKSGTAIIPSKCPVCNEKSEIIAQNEAKSLYCQNPNCNARLTQTLSHFTSRDAMNIDGFSIKTIEKFVERRYLNNYADIYELFHYKDDLMKMEGFGTKSVTNLFLSIEQSKKRELHNFIYALGIAQVGLAGAKLLCRHCNYDIEAIKAAPADELVKIDGFGEVLANSVATYFSNENNIALLNRALSHLNLQKPEISQTEQKLAGKIFVITGDVHIFKNRNELQKKIEENGGKVSSSVSGKTSFLINNDNLSESSKNKKAQKLEIPIITEEMFLKLI